MELNKILRSLEAEGNLRKLPKDLPTGYIDFTSNDYLGLASNRDLAREFISGLNEYRFSSSASRLLASSQEPYYALENLLESAYGRKVLMFNSGYHANTGIISAFAADSKCLVIADKLVHASIIDGVKLSRSEFRRFPHNDIKAAGKIIETNYDKFDNFLVITESIFSMDGDYAPVDELIMLKRNFPKVTLYIDEAHAFGVKGPKGLGMTQCEGASEECDIIVVPLGKAAASMGAFAVCSEEMREFLINKARSLIFSTALPPIQIEWTGFILHKIFEMDKEREYLESLSRFLSQVLFRITGKESKTISHIQPLVVGDPHKTIELSDLLYQNRIKALPIRKPTVPAGTERLRFSLSAAMDESYIERLETVLRCSTDIL